MRPVRRVSHSSVLPQRHCTLHVADCHKVHASRPPAVVSIEQPALLPRHRVVRGRVRVWTTTVTAQSRVSYCVRDDARPWNCSVAAHYSAMRPLGCGPRTARGREAAPLVMEARGAVAGPCVWERIGDVHNTSWRSLAASLSFIGRVRGGLERGLDGILPIATEVRYAASDRMRSGVFDTARRNRPRRPPLVEESWIPRALHREPRSLASRAASAAPR